MNWINENMYSSEWDGILLSQIKVREKKQSGNNADAVLNDITDLESESTKIMYLDPKAMLPWIVLIIRF